MKKDNNEIFDKILGQAAKIVMEEKMNEYPSVEEIEGKYEFSEQHEKRIAKLIKKDKRTHRRKENIYWQKIRKISFTAAAVICMIFTLSTVLAFTVAPIRIAIRNLLIEQNEKYTEIYTLPENKADINSFKGIPAYIPDGYEVSVIDENETMVSILYMNDIGKMIRFTRYMGEVILQVDNEDNSHRKIMINGNEGYISCKNDNTIIIFHDERFSYKIFTQENAEEAMKIAESIE